MQSTRAKRSFSKGLRSLVRSGWLVFWILIAGLLALPAWGPSNETESCIPASPVEASSPTKSIEAVRVGDMVMARDDLTGLIVPKRVVRVFHNTSDHLRILTIRNADGATQQIKTTNEHPFFVPDRGWTLASELTPGTQLQQFDDTSAILIATHLESHPKGIPTYNVEVEDFHTYFVADTSARGPPRYLLTHNMCAEAAGDLADEAGEGLVKSADNVTPNVLDNVGDVASKPKKIFRGGSDTPKNLTPRPKDIDGLSTRVNAPSGKSQVIDPEKLNKLEVVQDAADHASVRPKDKSRMQEWIDSRDSGETHEFTQELMDAIVDTERH